MAASARKRLVTLLDEDGDGEISWAEIEGGAADPSTLRGGPDTSLARARTAQDETAGWGWHHFLLSRREFQVHDPLLGQLPTTAWPRVKPCAHGAGVVVQGRQSASSRKTRHQLKAARDTLKRCSRSLRGVSTTTTRRGRASSRRLRTRPYCCARRRRLFSRPSMAQS